MSLPEPRPYYSQRLGSGAKIDLTRLQQFLVAVHEHLDAEHYWQESFGYICSDVGFVPGTLGRDPSNGITLRLRRPLWPLADGIGLFTEEDTFDLVEFLYDVVSQPTDARYHYDCGWHSETFSSLDGRRRFREEINPFLRDYRQGYELSDEGQILELAPPGLGRLLDQPVPSSSVQDAPNRIERAQTMFRAHGASDSEKRVAVRELFDLLEFIRPQLKDHISSKDEADLFNIANNYSIRHHNSKQKTEYDTGVWLTWKFYTVLNMLHVVLRLIDRQERSKPPLPPPPSN